MMRKSSCVSSVLLRQLSRTSITPKSPVYRNLHTNAAYCADESRRVSILLGGLAAITAASLSTAWSDSDDIPVVEVDGVREFSTVIIGGGTAGCTVAYLLAKWMEEKDIPGTVLLVERGHDYSASQGPDPRLKSWFEMWGSFGEAHMTIRKNGEHYPVPATDHRGLGGCSTHDTRINFQVTKQQLQRFADYMGWTVERLQSYYQAALNLIPVSRSIPVTRKEPLFDDVIRVLTKPKEMCNSDNEYYLRRVLASDERGEKARNPRQDDEYNTVVVPNSIAEVSMSMYGESGRMESADEVRYVSAYLVHEQIRPKNLKVLCNMTADRVIFDKEGSSRNRFRARNVLLQDDKGKAWSVDLGDNVSARKGDVVVTNGSLGATALLQRSGIGPSNALNMAGVDVLVDNPEVGHGLDHLEISLVHEWNKDLPVTRGGATGWPLVLFADLDSNKEGIRRNKDKPFPMYHPNEYFQAHFGAGLMDPNYDEPVMQMTPLVVNPDPEGGFRGYINSSNPKDNLLVINEDQTSDLESMALAVRKGVKMLEDIERAGLCGKRILPPPDLSLSNLDQVVNWIKENHWTVYHWSSTCKAGLEGIGTVADEKFRVRCSESGVIDNLFVGSAASLPEITEPNPHLTITAFSVALAEELLKSRCDSSELSEWVDPSDLRKASADLDRSNDHFPTCVIRRQGEETPPLWDSVVKDHHKRWMVSHPDCDQGNIVKNSNNKKK